jgi:lipopolysaccharide biosynthesis glycosyltransferase
MSTKPYPIVNNRRRRLPRHAVSGYRSLHREAERRTRPHEVYLLHDGFNEELQEKVFRSLPQGAARLTWIPVALDLFSSFPYNPHNTYLSKMAYGRILIPKIVPTDVSRVLYVDTDTLILNSLEPLWQTDLEGHPLGAVQDYDDGRNGDFDLQAGQSENSLYKGLPRVQRCFNSGVLLIDLDGWRERGIREKAFEYIRQYPKTPKMDPDVLNMACEAAKAVGSRGGTPKITSKKTIPRKTRPGFSTLAEIKPWLPRMRSRNVELTIAIGIAPFCPHPFEKPR